MPVIPASAARRMLLHAQCLFDDPARPATSAALQKLIERMGFVQVDTINVVARAHDLTLHSRLHGYRPNSLRTLLEDKRAFFEHWTHDASIIPVKWFSHWQHRYERSRTRIRQNAWWRERIGENADALVSAVLQRIIKSGPLLSRDFEHQRDENAGSGGWWGWKPQKAALEYLWRTGELAVARRVNFQKVYDLASRVLPDHCKVAAPELEQHIDWACESALERLGVATPAELAGFWHAVTLAQARQWCEEAARAGRIIAVSVESADGSKARTAFAPARWRTLARRADDAYQRIDKIDSTIRLLSPFDPILRDRARTRRLFNFDYTFEAFVPAPKRRYGYYVLPILEGDQLIGRINPKFNRQRSELEILGQWWEPTVKPTKRRRSALQEAIERLATFIGAKRIRKP